MILSHPAISIKHSHDKLQENPNFSLSSHFSGPAHVIPHKGGDQDALLPDIQAKSSRSSRCGGPAALLWAPLEWPSFSSIAKGEHAQPSHPTEETHFGCLYPRFYSFGHDSHLVTSALIHLLISRSIFPSHVNKTPTFLNSSTWGRVSSQTWRGYSTFSNWGNWSQFCMCWFSSKALHTGPLTAPVWVEDRWLMKLRESHHLQKAEI